MTEQPKRILVVEDNVAMSGVLRYVLERAEFDVTVANCGQAAWEVLREHDFDLIISDFKMPGMTGGELCERIREDPRLARTPIILLTVKGYELEAPYYLGDLSVIAIIPKPFSPRELTQIVENYLRAEATHV
jgi:CheY-like chemotaxis protein